MYVQRGIKFTFKRGMKKNKKKNNITHTHLTIKGVKNNRTHNQNQNKCLEEIIRIKNAFVLNTVVNQ